MRLFPIRFDVSNDPTDHIDLDNVMRIRLQDTSLVISLQDGKDTILTYTSAALAKSALNDLRAELEDIPATFKWYDMKLDGSQLLDVLNLFSVSRYQIRNHSLILYLTNHVEITYNFTDYTALMAFMTPFVTVIDSLPPKSTTGGVGLFSDLSDVPSYVSQANKLLSVNSSGTGVIWVANTFANRNIGVATSTDIPDRAAADTRYLQLTDYTASNLLTLIKTVDGTGSGLDAGLLEGQNGTYYRTWSNFLGTPTTRSGYGITDAQPLSSSLTSLASINWLAGTTIPVLTAANTWTTVQIGSSINSDVLNRFAGDARYLQLTGGTVGGTTVSAANIAQALILKGGTSDGSYISFFKEAAAQTTRSGYIGYTTANTNLYISNEITNGSIYLAPNGTGKAYVSGFEIWNAGNFTPSTKLDVSAYTAADILTKIKTVDGSSSGLDADLLDGRDSSGFARKFLAAATSSATTNTAFWTDDADLSVSYISGGTNYPDSSSIGAVYSFKAFNGASNSNYARAFELFKGSALNDTLYLRGFDGTGIGTTWRKLWTSGNFDPTLKLDASSYTASDVLTKLLTVDGTGSGLDADLLDGQSGVHYLTWSNFTGTPTTRAGYGITDAQPLDAGLTSIAGLTGSGVVTATGTDTFAMRNIGITNSTDIPDRSAADGRYARVDASNIFPARQTIAAGNYVDNTELFHLQPADYGAGKSRLFFSQNSGTWRIGTWDGTTAGLGTINFTTTNNIQHNGFTIWTAGNDGTGSGLDSDLLDGQQGSYYQNAGNLNAGTLLAARMPALTGDITTTAGAVATTLATVNSNVGSFGSATQVATFTVDAKGRITAAGNTTISLPWSAITSGKPTTLSGYGITDATSMTSTGLGVVGNLAYDSVTDTAAEWSALPVGYARMMASTIGIAGGAPLNANFGYFTKVANRDTSGGWGGLWLGYTAGQNYFGRTSDSSTLPSWEKIWTEANDGLGSGLDADLLDGQQGSYYQNAGNLNAGTLLAARMPALTGDITTTSGAVATTLATVNTNVGSFGSATQVATFTVNAKGLTTAAGNVTITPDWSSITNPPTTIAGYGITDLLSSIVAIDGAGSGIDADLLDGYNSSNTWGANTVAVRNSNGQLNATGLLFNNTVQFSLSGNGFSGHFAGNSFIPASTTTSSNATLGDSSYRWKGVYSGLIDTTGTISAGDTLTITKAGGDGLYLNGATSNTISFNTSGVGVPTFTTRSAGEKITLYPSLSASLANYGLGVAANTLWAGVPSTTDRFEWYGGTTKAATLTGAGALTLGGSLTGPSTGSFSISSVASGTAINLNGGLNVYNAGGAYQVDMPTSGILQWSADTRLWRESAGIVAIRTSTNAMGLRVYNTWANSGTDYERAGLYWSGNVMYLTSENGGSGNARSMVIRAANGLSFSGSSGSNGQWNINSTGNLYPNPANTYDLGSSSLTVRTGYFGTSIVVAGVTVIPSVSATANSTVVRDGNGSIYGQTVVLQQATPSIVWNEPDAGTDGKVWALYANAGALTFVTQTDAYGTGSTFMTVTRSGTSVSAINFAATSVGVTGALSATSFTGSGSGLTSIPAGQLTGTILAAQMPALTGDVSSTAGAVSTTLATVNSNVGSFGSATQVATFTVDAKGRTTAAGNTTIAIPWSAIASGKPTTLSGYGITDAAALTHKYHEFATGQYFFDSFQQERNFRLFTENAYSDQIRFGAIANIEYHNGTTWTTWVGGSSTIQPLLDGREDTQSFIDHTHRKFRFEVTANSGWPTLGMLVLQSAWYGFTTPNIEVTVEKLVSGVWTTKATATFNSTNTAANWGMHVYMTSALHDGITAYRFTIDITDWTDVGAYTTVPLKRLMLLSNYIGSPLQPWTWNYNKVVNFSAVPTVNGASVWTSANDGTGSGLDADLLDGLNATSATTGNTIVARDVNGSVFGTNIIAQQSAPAFNWNETDGATNAKLWTLGVNGGVMTGTTLTDAYGAGSTWLSVTRSGTTVSAIALAATAVTINGGTAWHSGNDGASSGLDADLLDGFNSSASDAASSIPVRDSNGYLSQRVIANTTSSSADGMYVGYGNAGGTGSITRIYGGGSTTAALRVNASNVTYYNGTTNSNVWYHGNLPLDAWTNSADSQPRFYFANAGPSYYASANHHYFRNGSDVDMMTISSVGNVVVTAGLTAVTVSATSDRSLKKDISPYASGSLVTSLLKPSRFTWKKTNKPSLGFIAQDVQEVLPEAVICGEDGILSIDHMPLIAVLTQALQETRKELTDLWSKYESLALRIADLEN